MRRSNLQNLALTLLLSLASASASAAESFKFGVMSDTQWSRDDGRNPGSCSVEIVKAINRQFVKHGVKFVIQVGDLVDKTGSTAESVAASEDMRAVYAQELYNAGIGFFPVRGNHDGHPLAAVEFKRIYPQTMNGAMNSSPRTSSRYPIPMPRCSPSQRRRVRSLYWARTSAVLARSGQKDWTGRG